jgi:hypothetical protein
MPSGSIGATPGTRCSSSSRQASGSWRGGSATARGPLRGPRARHAPPGGRDAVADGVHREPCGAQRLDEVGDHAAGRGPDHRVYVAEGPLGPGEDVGDHGATLVPSGESGGRHHLDALLAQTSLQRVQRLQVDALPYVDDPSAKASLEPVRGKCGARGLRRRRGGRSPAREPAPGRREAQRTGPRRRGPAARSARPSAPSYPQP